MVVEISQEEYEAELDKYRKRKHGLSDRAKAIIKDARTDTGSGRVPTKDVIALLDKMLPEEGPFTLAQVKHIIHKEVV